MSSYLKNRPNLNKNHGHEWFLYLIDQSIRGNTVETYRCLNCNRVAYYVKKSK